MKRFSQFLGIHQGKDRFRQRPNAILSQNLLNGLDDDGNLWNASKNPIESGGINGTTGEDTTAVSRIRVNGYIAVKPNTTYSLSSNMSHGFIVEYGADKKALGLNSRLVQTPFEYTTTANCAYIRIALGNTGQNVSVNDFEWLRFEERSE